MAALAARYRGIFPNIMPPLEVTDGRGREGQPTVGIIGAVFGGFTGR